MATMSLANISAFLNLVYGMGVTANFRRDVVLPNIVDTVTEGNSTCTWRTEIAARNTAAAKAQGYAVQDSDFSSDAKLQATIAWAHYESYASIDGTAQRVNSANKGQDVDELGHELQAAAEELAQKISVDSYSGDYTASPVQIGGLAAAVAATGTYAGIAQGSYASWAAGANTGALASLDLNMIRTKLIRPYKDAVGKVPALILTDGTVYDKVVSLFDAKSLIEVTTVMSSSGEQVDIGKLGFRGIKVDGVTVLEDRHCTSQTMYAVDPRFMEYVQTPPVWTSMDPGQLQGIVKELSGQQIPIEDIVAAQFAAKRKPTAQINALAKTGDSTRVQLVIDIQLRLRRRSAAAKLTLS